MISPPRRKNNINKVMDIIRLDYKCISEVYCTMISYFAIFKMHFTLCIFYDLKKDRLFAYKENFTEL